MDCGKLGDFGSVHGMFIGRAGEVVETLSDRKVDVACIQETMVASSVELKAKDISCSGWEVRRLLLQPFYCSLDKDQRAAKWL